MRLRHLTSFWMSSFAPRFCNSITPSRNPELAAMIMGVFPNWGQGSTRTHTDKTVKVRGSWHIQTELANRNNQPAYIMTELSLQPKPQQSTMEDITEGRATHLLHLWRSYWRSCSDKPWVPAFDDVRWILFSDFYQSLLSNSSLLKPRIVRVIACTHTHTHTHTNEPRYLDIAICCGGDLGRKKT